MAKKNEKEHEPDPWADVKKASELDTDGLMKALIYGPSGSMKSTMLARFEKPLIGLTELQAAPIIKLNNPNALIRPIRNMKDLIAFMKLVKQPDLAKRVDAVGLDSLTDAQRILINHYTAQQENRIDTTNQDTWGVVINRTFRLARELRDLPVHVLCICLDREEEGGIHRPAVSGKRLPNDLAQCFSLVGYAYKKEHDDGKIRREVLFSGPERFLTKDFPGIDMIEPPEPQMWIHKVFDGDIHADVINRVDEWTKVAHSEDEDGED